MKTIDVWALVCAACLSGLAASCATGGDPPKAFHEESLIANGTTTGWSWCRESDNACDCYTPPGCVQTSCGCDYTQCGGICSYRSTWQILNVGCGTIDGICGCPNAPPGYVLDFADCTDNVPANCNGFCNYECPRQQAESVPR
jgi:hypothetical protein